MEAEDAEAARGAPAASQSPVAVGEGPVHVVISTADQMFLDIKPEMTARMPRYKGDLELINHSAGSLTSRGVSQALEPQERTAGRRRREGLRGRRVAGRARLIRSSA